MSEEIDKQIKERIQEIFPDQATASKLINLVVHKRPPGHSRKSVSPYYKEAYALKIKPDVDAMIANKQPRLFSYAKWCTDETGISQRTLYHRINQSIRYLVDNMDKDGIYFKWIHDVKVEQIAGRGIKLSYTIPTDIESGLSSEEIIPTEETPTWKLKLDQWIESDSTYPFILERLALTQDEVVQLKLELGNLSNIQFSINQSAIKVIKMAA